VGGAVGLWAVRMTLPKRLLVGRALASRALGETLLPKWLALPIFCSDALSSVAYATEAILVALSVGGLAFHHVAPYLAVAVLFVIVAASYQQTCQAYPGVGAPTSSVTRTWAVRLGWWPRRRCWWITC
jgi:hypothetical protein